MIWWLSIPVFLIIAQQAIWLYALDVTIKMQSRVRILMYPGSASQLPQIDSSDLQPLTQELEALGFVVLGDLITYMDYEPVHSPATAPIPDPNQPAPSNTNPTTETKGIARILAHPRHGCYAQLFSVVAISRFPTGLNRPDMVNVAPFRTVIISTSRSNREENEWSFATHNREFQSMSVLHRHPRQIGRRMLGATAQQLLDSHLKERQDIANRAHISWDYEPSLEKYRDFEERNVKFIKSIYLKLSTLTAVKTLISARFEKHDLWLGDLAKQP